MSSPTKLEKRYHDWLARNVGCIACRLDGVGNSYVSIHHCDGRTKPGAHRKVLPLCAAHHQTGGEAAPSIHPWKAQFWAKYGTQEALIDICVAMLKKQNPNLWEELFNAES